MKIGFDASALLIARKTGVERYVEALLDAMDVRLKEHPDLEVLLYAHSGNHLADKSLEPCFARRYSRLRWRSFPWRRGYDLALPLMALQDQVDLLHLPAPRPLRIVPKPMLVTVHDLAWLHLTGDAYAVEGQASRHRIERGLHQASFAICDSQSTLIDLIEYYEWPSGRTQVVPLAGDPSFVPVAATESDGFRERHGLGPYIVNVASLQYRKNHQRLIDAFGKLVEQYAIPHQLVLVGRDGWGAEAIYEHIAQADVSDRVRVMGYLPDEEMSALYAAADLVVYPSLWEGFGLPVLEAMACGSVVVASDRSSIPEVGGDAVIYCNPDDASDISRAMWRALSDQNLRRRMRDGATAQAAEFSWPRTADATLDCYRRVARSQ